MGKHQNRGASKEQSLSVSPEPPGFKTRKRGTCFSHLWSCNWESLRLTDEVNPHQRALSVVQAATLRAAGCRDQSCSVIAGFLPDSLP